MKTINQQRGMATLLVVLLVGISIMLITAGFAKTLMSKKEASVAAHAQTNAQIMGWAGVSAFREYLTNVGRGDVARIRALQGTSVTLRSDPDQKEIIAKNIQVTGCTVEGQNCVVTAQLSSNNKTSKAATTIQAVYNLSLKDAPPQAAQNNVLSFTGDTSLMSTFIDAETPNTKAVLNVAGTTRILGGLKTNNISEIVINSKGDVYVDCSAVECTKAKMTIFAEGQVHITDRGLSPQLNIGNIKANKDVYLQTNVSAGHIASGDNVFIATGSSAQTVTAYNSVVISDRSRATDVISDNDVSVLSNSTVNSIQAKGFVLLSAATVNSDVKAYQYIDMNTGAEIKGSAYAKGRTTIPLSDNMTVRMIISRIRGNVFANHNLRLLDIDWQKDIDGNVRLTGHAQSSYLVYSILYGDIAAQVKRHIGGQLFENQQNISELNFSISGINRDTLRQEILAQMDFETKVDVRAYKQDANYIFTRSNGVDRVYLNHLKNAATGITYMYEDGHQYKVESNGAKTKVNDEGFSIGRYTSASGQQYIGAICLTVDQVRVISNILTYAKCTSDIIGYLPRLSVGTTAGIDNDYDYLPVSNDWHVRTTSATSPLDNAAFAPGIMYFEGNLHLSGNGNLKADSSTNAFTNTFLAEGDLNVVAASPKIYSPYNVIRDGQASLICNRDLKTISGDRPSPLNTTPATLSSKYLIPVNLCRDSNTFNYNMNKDAQGERTYVNIDNKPVKKLDLGYVALMGNKVVRIGTCAQIYGDVLSRGTIEGSAACGITSDKNKIVGSLSSQGEAPYVSNVQQHNTFGAGSKLVIPKAEFTNAVNTPATASNGTGVDTVALNWSKYN